MISEAAFDKCADDAEKYRERIIYGGEGDRARLTYSPTMIYPVGIEEDIVKKKQFIFLKNNKQKRQGHKND